MMWYSEVIEEVKTMLTYHINFVSKNRAFCYSDDSDHEKFVCTDLNEAKMEIEWIFSLQYVMAIMLTFEDQKLVHCNVFTNNIESYKNIDKTKRISCVYVMDQFDCKLVGKSRNKYQAIRIANSIGKKPNQLICIIDYDVLGNHICHQIIN